MKLTINRDTFLKAVTQCNIPVVNTGNKALACAALVATKDLKSPGPDSLSLRSTNGLIAIEPLVLCKVEEEGDCAVNFKMLRDAIATMPGGDLSVELTKKGKLVVTHGKRRWTSDTLPEKDVPKVPDPSTSTMKLRFGARELLDCVSRLEFVMDNVPKDQTARQGVYLDVVEKQLSAVAIGEHMFAYNKPPTERCDAGGKPFRMLLPQYALKQVRELAAEDENIVLELRALDGAYSWLSDSSTLLCMVPPRGEYTDWRKLFAAVKHTPICRIPRLALLNSLNAFISTSTNPYHHMTVTLFADGSLGIEPAEGDHFQDRIPVTDIVAKELPTFTLQAQYLRDALKAANADALLTTLDNGIGIGLQTDDGFLAMISLAHPPKK